MANFEHLTPQLGIIRQGVDVWNQWREQYPSRRPDLSDADLKWAKLDGVNFSDIELGGAKLNGATLRRANLKNARLIGADLTGADLRNATLVEAWLIGAKLLRTDLREADLRGAIFAETILSETDLTAARGLDSCRHMGPSIIDHRTLLKSGNLAPEFLQGCGLPQELAEALPRLLADVKYYTCFISYGEPDKEFALKLYDDLKQSSLSCWLYCVDSTVGQPTGKEIGQNRRAAEKMLVLCSCKALIRDGMLKEIEDQIDEDPSKLVPISLDNIWTQPGFPVLRGANNLKPHLLVPNYADFSNLCYTDALSRLLKGLERSNKAF